MTYIKFISFFGHRNLRTSCEGNDVEVLGLDGVGAITIGPSKCFIFTTWASGRNETRRDDCMDLELGNPKILGEGWLMRLSTEGFQRL